MKISIKENKLRALVKESVNNILNEIYDTNKFYSRASGIFNNDVALTKLELLVYNIAHESIERTTNRNGEYNGVIWDDFIEGIVKLYNISKEKAEYDKLNIKQIYQEYVNNGKEDEFWDEYDYEYIDSYLGQHGKTELWDKYIPKPEVVVNLVHEFVSWLKRYTDEDINEYAVNKEKEYEWITNFLSKNI